jgi:fatty-acyl-CoA synthase
VDEYPKTVTGKIQKFKLREMGIARFGLEKAAAVETA